MKIDGVDVSRGIFNCGGLEDAYVEVLQVFHKNCTSQIEIFTNALKNGDFSRYIIEVHGIKSALRAIGATDLGNTAYELELAARSQDVQTLNSKTDDFVSSLNYLLDVIKPYLSGKTMGDKPFDKIEILAALQTAKAYSLDFDLDCAGAVILHLFDYKLDAECFDALNKIDTEAASFSVSGVVHALDNMILLVDKIDG